MTTPLPLRLLALLLAGWLLATPASLDAQASALPAPSLEATVGGAPWSAEGVWATDPGDRAGVPLAELPGYFNAAPALAPARFDFSAEDAAPETFALQTPFPNPFHAETTVRYTLAEAASVRLEAFDALGRRVALLAEGARAPGTYTATLDGGGLTPGLYLVRLTATGPSGERTATRRALRVP